MDGIPGRASWNAAFQGSSLESWTCCLDLWLTALAACRSVQDPTSSLFFCRWFNPLLFSDIHPWIYVQEWGHIKRKRTLIIYYVQGETSRKSAHISTIIQLRSAPSGSLESPARIALWPDTQTSPNLNLQSGVLSFFFVFFWCIRSPYTIIYWNWCDIHARMENMKLWNQLNAW